MSDIKIDTSLFVGGPLSTNNVYNPNNSLGFNTLGIDNSASMTINISKIPIDAKHGKTTILEMANDIQELTQEIKSLKDEYNAHINELLQEIKALKNGMERSK
jgi:hypothetical protein